MRVKEALKDDFDAELTATELEEIYKLNDTLERQYTKGLKDEHSTED